MSKYKYKVGDRVVCVSIRRGGYPLKNPVVGKVYRIKRIYDNKAFVENGWAYNLSDFIPYKKVLINGLLKDE